MEIVNVNSLKEIEDFFNKILVENFSEYSRIKLGLPGGRSVKPILNSLKRLDKDFLSKFEFYLVDERLTEDYNYDNLMENGFSELLDNGLVNSSQIKFPDISLNPSDIIKDYEKKYNGLDLAVLGIGEDCHVASLFPNHPLLNSKEKIIFVDDSPKPPKMRLSVSLNELLRSKVKVLLFLGEGKREAYLNYLNNNENNLYPCSFFKDDVYVLTDIKV